MNSMPDNLIDSTVTSPPYDNIRSNNGYTFNSVTTQNMQQHMQQGLMNQILQGDCLEIMQSMPDNFIDLTVTSPAYDNLRAYKGYTFNFEASAKELYRITKHGGVVVWVVGDATVDGSETCTSDRQKLYFKDVVGFNIHDTMIYAKDSCPFPERNRYYPSFEYMFILSKGKPQTVNLIADKPNKTYGAKASAGTERQRDGSMKPRKGERLVKEFGVRPNIWAYKVGCGKTTKDAYAYVHPAMFPEDLARDHIISWSNEGDLIFDPMCGAGTTLKMAKLNNRNYLGIDIAEEYVEIAKRRVEDLE